MSVILKKVLFVSYSPDESIDVSLPKQPIFQNYGFGHFTLYMPVGTAVSARLRLIREFIQRGYTLTSISPVRACNASFRKEIKS